ncbi:hypothetical protein [Pontibacillus halophilus]|uniref:hypothetical protein n=1 Tax=Pontibacillus halophilus TaxID=516704 RepID=UPI00041964B1|nr:hypothetical protein [Pontibacillus halophilus]
MSALFEILVDILVDFFKPFFEKIGEALFGFRSLIFGDKEDLVYSTFAESDLENVIGPGMNMFTVISTIFVLFGILYTGFQISKAGINPGNRTSLIQSITDWVLVAFVIVNLGTLLDIVFTTNTAFVDFFGKAVEDVEDSDTNLVPEDDILWWLLIKLVEIGLSLWATVYYGMRSLSLMILTITLPAIIAFWLFPQTKSIVTTWIKEIIGTTFVQSVHAVLFFIITASSMTDSGSNLEFQQLIMMIIFIPTGESIKGLLGMGGSLHGTMSKTGAMFGMSALSGAYGSIKGAMDGKGVYESLKSAGSKAKNQAKDANSMNANSSGEGDIADTRANRMLSAGEIFSKGGKAVAGAAGSVAGSALGPAGSIAGATAGSAVGGAVGGATGRVAYSVGSTLSRSAKDGIEGAKKEMNDGLLADEIADNQVSQWAADENGGMEKFNELKERGFTGDKLESAWNAEKRNKRKEFKKQALSDLESFNSSTDYADGNSLVQNVANEQTDSWANRNESQFKSDLKNNHPQMSDDEIQQQWEDKLRFKRNDILSVTQDAAQEVNGGEALKEGQQIDRKQFVDTATKGLQNLENQEIDNAYFAQLEKNGRSVDRSDPNIQQEAESARFKDSNYLTSQDEIATGVNNSSKRVEGGKGIATGGKVNVEAASRHMASEMTNRQKQEFIDAGNSHQDWEAIEGQEYQKNLSHAKAVMPEQAKSNPNYSNKILQTGAVKLQGAARVTKGATKGFASGLYEHSGAKGVVEDSKVVAATKSATEAFKTNAVHASHQTGEHGGGVITSQIAGVSSGTVAAVKEGFNTFKNHEPESAIERHTNSRNRRAYVRGTFGGQSGYQKSYQRSEQKGRFKKAAEQEALEIGEIANQVKTETTFNPKTQQPETSMADGALKTVVTREKSYVQMVNNQGETKIVSQIGAGDPSLKKGEKVYQDIEIVDNQLTPSTPYYNSDSSGGKVLVESQPNVNVNKLVGNKTLPQKQYKQQQEHIPMSPSVDNRQYTMSDIKDNSGSDNYQYVVEKDRSYVVMENKNGEQVRVSPYGKGDNSFNNNQRNTTRMEIKNNQFVLSTGEQNTVFDDGEGKVAETTYTPNHDPNELIPERPNKRFIRRQQLEEERFTNVGV